MIHTKTKKQVRVRIAPSPTGPFHIGTARTALFNWLYAKKHGGVFVLRIEDTDAKRSDPKYENDILEGLSWLGIIWDEGPLHADQSRLEEAQMSADNQRKSASGNLRKLAYIGEFGPYRQSERLDIYEKYLNKLLDEERAYFCYCTKKELEEERQSLLSQGMSPKYMGKCRSYTSPPEGKTPEVIRFKVSEKIIEFNDMIRGRITIDSGLIGDIAIAKIISMKNKSKQNNHARPPNNIENHRFSPLFNFAVTIDDAVMDISHVIRGEDHISNTPKQIMIQEALGFKTPFYAHLPLILSSNRSKLSKRYGETSVLNYRDLGYLPEAIANFIAFLGWHPKDDREIMTLEELANEFDLNRVQKAGAIYSEDKLAWLNSKHLKRKSDVDLAQILISKLKEKGINISALKLQKILHIEKERMKTINDFFILADFFIELPEYSAELLSWKSATREKTKEYLEKIHKIILNLQEPIFSAIEIEASLSSIVKEVGRGEILWPLRAALSGKKESPGPYEIAEILGKKETIQRLEIALEKLI